MLLIWKIGKLLGHITSLRQTEINLVHIKKTSLPVRTSLMPTSDCLVPFNNFSKEVLLKAPQLEVFKACEEDY